MNYDEMTTKEIRIMAGTRGYDLAAMDSRKGLIAWLELKDLLNA